MEIKEQPYNIHIERDEPANQWKVVRDQPGNKVSKGQDVVWVLDAPPPGYGGGSLSAQFQFADHDLVQGNKLTPDLTAKIDNPGEFLTLKIKGDAYTRLNPRYYAVWIMDSNYPSGGVYAVGETGNPPPELEIGP